MINTLTENNQYKPLARGRNNGRSTDPYYVIYTNIINRCYNPKAFAYEHYGGRGIEVFSEWIDKDNGVDNFSMFIENVLGSRPSQEYTLDRIDNNKDYEPGNLRWANKQLQSINKRTYKNNKSGHKGVFYSKSKHKWIAQIRLAGKAKELGQFLDIADAISARKTAEIVYFKPLGVEL